MVPAGGVQRSEAPLVSIDDIDKSFGSVEVLDGISFSVEAGTVTAIAGPNGSGKTTLSRIIVGLNAPDSGQVTIRTAAERPVGYLPQTPQFSPGFTVEEVLNDYADLLSTSPDIDDALSRVGLDAVRERRVSALSGGMRRLLGLAQSFLGEPPLVVLDEPTSGLDPRMTRRFFEVAEELADDGMAVLVTTHDLASASDTDMIAVLHQGTLAAHDSPTALCDATGTETLADAFLEFVGIEPTVQSGLRGEPR